MTATVYTRVHILSDQPMVEVNEATYPSIEISEGMESSVIVTVTGSADDRRTFADALRAAAETVDAWTPARGREVQAQADAPESVAS